jgi:hypothetical protein
VLRTGVRRATGEADARRRRGDVDDVTAAAGAHPRQCLLHPVQDPVDVDVDDPPRGRVGLGVERAQRHDPGVVDEHVERAEPSLDGVEEGPHRVALDDVDVQRDRAVTELGRGLLGGGVVEIADRDLHPGAHARGRGRAADPSRGAGDRDDLAFE